MSESVKMNGTPNKEKYPPQDASPKTPPEDAPKEIAPEKVPDIASSDDTTKTTPKASSAVTTENISPKTPVKIESPKATAETATAKVTPGKKCAVDDDADKSQASEEMTSQSESVELGSENDSLGQSSEGGSLEFPSEGELSEESFEEGGFTKGLDETGKAESVKALEKTSSEISGKDQNIASSEGELSEESCEAKSGATKGFGETKSKIVVDDQLLKSPEKRKPRLNRRDFELRSKLFDLEMSQPKVKKTFVAAEKRQTNVPVQRKIISLVPTKKTVTEVKPPKEGKKIVLKRKASSSFDEEEKTKSAGETSSVGTPQKKKYKPITWP